MTKTFTRFAFLFALITFLAACKSEEVNQVTIDIQEPTAGETVADASQVHIHIELTATEELHDIHIHLHPDGDVSNMIIEQDIHSHEMTHTFMQDVDLSSFPSGTKFHLEVETCIDHDCEEEAKEEIDFFIP